MAFATAKVTSKLNDVLIFSKLGVCTSQLTSYQLDVYGTTQSTNMIISSNLSIGTSISLAATGNALCTNIGVSNKTTTSSIYATEYQNLPIASPTVAGIVRLTDSYTLPNSQLASSAMALKSLNDIVNLMNPLQWHPTTSNNLLYSRGSIGIGATPSDSFLLDVANGLLVRTGTLGVGATAVDMSKSLDVTGATILRNAVGIMTDSNASFALDVSGTTRMLNAKVQNTLSVDNIVSPNFNVVVNSSRFSLNGQLCNYSDVVKFDTTGNGELKGNLNVTGNIVTSSNVYCSAQVGIGLQNPQFPLHVRSTNPLSGAFFMLGANANQTSGIYMNIQDTVRSNTNSVALLAVDDGNGSAHLRVRTSGEDRMIILSNGNIGIGSTTWLPTYKLEVTGNARVSTNLNVDGRLTAGSINLPGRIDVGDTLTCGIMTSNSAYVWGFLTAGATGFVVDGSGNLKVRSVNITNNELVTGTIRVGVSTANTSYVTGFLTAGGNNFVVDAGGSMRATNVTTAGTMQCGVSTCTTAYVSGALTAGSNNFSVATNGIVTTREINVDTIKSGFSTSLSSFVCGYLTAGSQGFVVDTVGNVRGQNVVANNFTVGVSTATTSFVSSRLGVGTLQEFNVGMNGDVTTRTINVGVCTAQNVNVSGFVTSTSATITNAFVGSMSFGGNVGISSTRVTLPGGSVILASDGKNYMKGVTVFDTSALVGINSTAPSTTLDVVGTARVSSTLVSNGQFTCNANVNIVGSNMYPSAGEIYNALTIFNGQCQAIDPRGCGAKIIFNHSMDLATNTQPLRSAYVRSYQSEQGAKSVGLSFGGSYNFVQTDDIMVITGSGSIGIGTTNPFAKLEVVGSVICNQQIVLGNSGWALGGIRFRSVNGTSDSGIAQMSDGTLKIRAPALDGAGGIKLVNGGDTATLLSVSNVGVLAGINNNFTVDQSGNLAAATLAAASATLTSATLSGRLNAGSAIVSGNTRTGTLTVDTSMTCGSISSTSLDTTTGDVTTNAITAKADVNMQRGLIISKTSGTGRLTTFKVTNDGYMTRNVPVIHRYNDAGMVIESSKTTKVSFPRVGSLNLNDGSSGLVYSANTLSFTNSDPANITRAYIVSYVIVWGSTSSGNFNRASWIQIGGDTDMRLGYISTDSSTVYTEHAVTSGCSPVVLGPNAAFSIMVYQQSGSSQVIGSTTNDYSQMTQNKVSITVMPL